jgi:glycosyltransferase involved in cell wall biosynthesis
MKKVYLFSNIYPKYRKSVWDRLLQVENLNISFFFSNKTIDNIATVSVEEEYTVNDQKAFKIIKNIFFDKLLIWQTGVLTRTFDSISAVFFLGEMSVISTWIASVIFRLRGVKVIFWGHGIYGNESNIKLAIRKAFLRLADHNLVYEKRAKRIMTELGFKQNKISIVYNSINYEQQLDLFQKLEKEKKNSIFENNYPILLFVGRLTKQKKLDQLIKSLKILNEKSNYNLLIIGDGEEKLNLEELAQDLIKENKCIFYGMTYDEEELSRLIYNSDLTVSPGNVGLTAIHSLSYGVPVCTHNNFNFQMPEFEAIKEFENGIFFNENDLDDLTLKILLWFSRYDGKSTKTKIRRVVDEYYNHFYQIEVLKKFLV